MTERDIIKALDANTYEQATYAPTTIWADGTAMDDSKCDGVIYKKLVGGAYVKRAYTGPVNVKWWGVKGDGVTDDTVNINKALVVTSALGGTLLFPDGVYMVNVGAGYGKGLVVFSNTQIQIVPGATIQAITSSSSAYSVFFAFNEKNIKIFGGGIIKGDRDTHIGIVGEGGMGIYLYESDNIIIDNVTTRDFWGDGIYIGGSQDSAQANIGCENVLISNVISDNNRRQGMSIASGRHIIVRDSIFSNTNGTNPQSGIDIEPNLYQLTDDIVISGCKFFGNVGSGVSLLARPTGAYISNIVIDGCAFINDNIVSAGVALYFKVNYVNITNNSFIINSGYTMNIIDGSFNFNIKSNNIVSTSIDAPAINISKSGHIKISDNIIEGSGRQGIILTGVAADSCTIQNNSIINSGSAATNTYSGILLTAGALNNNIQGNTITSDATLRMKYAIELDATAGRNNIIVNNKMLGSYTTVRLFDGTAAGLNQVYEYFLNKSAALTAPAPTAATLTSPAAAATYTPADIQKMVDDITGLVSKLNATETRLADLISKQQAANQQT